MGGVRHLGRLRRRWAASSSRTQHPATKYGFWETGRRQGIYAELKKVGGDDADLLFAKDAEPILRQGAYGFTWIREFVKAITKKHLQR